MHDDVMTRSGTPALCGYCHVRPPREPGAVLCGPCRVVAVRAMRKPGRAPEFLPGTGQRMPVVFLPWSLEIRR